MQDENQRLVQPEAPQKTEEQRQLEARAQQILHRVKHIIIRKNTQFILDHQNDSLEQLSFCPASSRSSHEETLSLF